MVPTISNIIRFAPTLVVGYLLLVVRQNHHLIIN